MGAGRAAEGLRAGWLEQLADAARTGGFRYVRFHGLFHDDMFAFRLEDGRPAYNFQYIDELFDRLLALGVRPFVELGFAPRALATDTETVFWWKAHGSMPKDLDAWAELIRATCAHWVSRYGTAEVRTWYFEVWNEPNLKPFFSGGKAAYFALYDCTARAVKSVDAALRVGGPSTSNFVPDDRFSGDEEDAAEHAVVRAAAESGTLDDLDWQPVWVGEFLDHCATEGLPVDFVSVHPYPTDWPLDEHGHGLRLTRGKDATPRDLRVLHDLVAESPFPTAELHCTEWSSSSSSRDFTHDFPQAATFVIRSVLHALGTVHALAYWTFTDVFEEQGAGDAAFHGGFGMISLQGVPKPTLHAYRFLHRLGDELLRADDDGVVTRHSATGRITALLYNYPVEFATAVPASWDTAETAEYTLATGRDVDREIAWDGATPGASFTIERIDADHAHVFAAWQAMGSPASPTRTEMAALLTAASPPPEAGPTADAAGAVRSSVLLPRWGVALIDQQLEEHRD